MPHSSGGGRRGGGSHGGSHGGHHGGASIRGGKIKTHRFRGASSYHYYKGKKLHHVYSTFDFTTPEYRKSCKENVIIWIIVYLIGMLFTSYCFLKPVAKLDKKYVHNTLVKVEDSADLLSAEEEQSLQKTLQIFYKKTGIPVEIATVEKADWAEKEYQYKTYKTLEKYAYARYLHEFTDEGHWLIVYSVEDASDPDSYWEWEGMQGNYTDDILSNIKTKNFNAAVTEDLESGLYTVGEAFDKELRKFAWTARLADRIEFTVIFLAVIGFALSFFVLEALVEWLRAKRYKTCIKTVDSATPIKCAGCGGEYYEADYAGQCPYCNPH